MKGYVIAAVLCAASLVNAVYHPSCQQRNNLYQPTTSAGGVACGAFLQKSMLLVNSSWQKQNCPGGMLFDTRVCVCVRARNAQCVTIKSAPSCTENGNHYEPIYYNGIPCGGFQQKDLVHGFVKETHECPANLRFDARPGVCVCNYADAFRCPIV